VTDRLAGRRRAAGGWAAGIGLAILAGEVLLPKGLDSGAVALGVVFGCLNALVAMGLVLVFRSSRVINFAQASFGGLAAAVMVTMVAGWHVPYLAALPVALAFALGSGAATDRLVVRRMWKAPRLLLTVATIGVGQVVAAMQLGLPLLLSKKVTAFTIFRTPLHRWHFSIHTTYFTGDSVLAVAVVVVVLVALGWFLGRTEIGTAMRAAADSQERAILLGIPVAKLSLVTWTVAAGLSGLGTLLAVPVEGQNLGQVIGPTGLLVPLAAAVIARMESLPVAFAAAVGINVAEQAIFWSHPRSSSVDLGVFVIILVSLLLQRRRMGRFVAALGDHLSFKEVRPVPEALKRLPTYEALRSGLGLVVAAVVVIVIPFTFSSARLFIAASAAIYGIVAVSLVPLSGWAGQISLGQFALAGAGAATTGSLLVHFNVDLFLALAASAGVGGLLALAVGLPALRIPGTYLAAVTMAFAVPVSSYFLSQIYFPALNPTDVVRPNLFGKVSLQSPRAFYWLCLALLAVALHLTKNLRNSRAGRVILAARDNEAAAASFSISPLRTKLTAFAYSGALAALAGGLYVVGNRGLGFTGIDPELSIDVFLMVAIGGLGSTTGAVLGVVYVEVVQYILPGYAQLLATGGGLLLLLLLAPGGLGQILYALRDRALSLLARRKGIEISALWEASHFEKEVAAVPPRGSANGSEGRRPLLECDGIDASYGSIQVLFGVDMEVSAGEIVGLLGTNGAGKSTLLRVISGLLPARNGRLVFDGKDLGSLSPIDRVKDGVVTVPGGRGVFPSLTVEENLAVAGWRARHDGRDPGADLEKALRLFPALRERWTARAGDLSGGEQQMLTIAQALLCAPRLLLIDELTLGLAPVVVAGLLEAVRTMVREGVTAVVVEQSVNVAVDLAETAVFMERGQVRYSGPTSQLSKRKDLLRPVFLGVAPSLERGPSAESASDTQAAGALFRVDDLTKSYGGVVALDDVSLSVSDGEILGIIGSNGSGKTTLFDVCSGFVSPDRGRIRLGEDDITSAGAPTRAALGMGRVFQDARLFPALTVAEVVAVAFERHVRVRDPLLCMAGMESVRRSEAEVADGVDELLELLHLQRYRDNFVSELSTGTRRIVELACVMAHEPTLLLLDEPSSGIAQRETEALARMLVDLQSATGVTMLLVEHDMPLVSSVSDRLVCMHLGRILSEGEPAAVLSDPAVIASYLGDSDSALNRSGRRRRAKRTASPSKPTGTRSRSSATAGSAAANGARTRKAAAGTTEAKR
jgi:ABC-type branched-subunit amino acid transport system ATPase component/ABC-type branched-subunit amino acid transport system permease subunit